MVGSESNEPVFEKYGLILDTESLLLLYSEYRIARSIVQTRH